MFGGVDCYFGLVVRVCLVHKFYGCATGDYSNLLYHEKERMKKNLIDIQNRKIYGRSGKEYLIDIENISTGRWPEFELQQSELGLNATYPQMLQSFTDIYKLLSSGNDIIGNHVKARDLAKERIDVMVPYNDSMIPKLVKYFAIFSVAEGEDVGTYTEQMIRAKNDDWREIPHKAFFFLLKYVIPDLTDKYYEDWEDWDKTLRKFLIIPEIKEEKV